MPRAPSPGRSLLVHAALVAVAFGLLGLVLWQHRGQIREVLGRPLDGRLFAAAFAVYATALVLTFVRWFILVRALELPFRVRDALRLGFIGNVFNLIIPGGVGGDVIKAAYLCREQSRRTQAVASMVIDRAVGLLALFVLAGGSGLVAWRAATPDVRRLVAVACAAAASGLIGLAVLFTPALYRPLEHLVAGRGRLETFLEELVAMAGSYRRRIGTVAAMLALSAGTHALFVTAFFLVGHALFPAGIPALAQHLLIVPLVLFTTAVPLPFGALGLSEAVSDQLFAMVGHPGGAIAMMGFRVLMYGGGLLSLLVYLLNLRQVRELSRDAAKLAPIEA